MAPKRGAAKAGHGPEPGSREAALHQKLCSNIIDPNIKVRFKSLINRDNKKDACTLKHPKLGLNLLQTAIIADNVAAGQRRFPLSLPLSSASHCPLHVDLSILFWLQAIPDSTSTAFDLPLYSS